MSTRRVVVTGLGALTPLANDFPGTWERLLRGESGIGAITAFDCTGYDCRIAGEVRNFDPASGFKNPKDVRRTDRYTHLAMGAAAEAWKDCGLQEGSFDADRAGVLVGSGIGGLRTLEEQHSILRDRGPKKVSPFMIPMMINNIASGHISMQYGLRGPNFAIVSACATASHSIGEAWRLIREDEADIIVAGGSEAAVVGLGLSGFAAMKALSTRNEEPTKASRPFDKNRDGFVLSEGAGIVVLEELEHAKKRGAKIYGEVAGYGATADAHHLTAPAPEGAGAARAMKIALKHAQLRPDRSATSTPTAPPLRRATSAKPRPSSPSSATTPKRRPSAPPSPTSATCSAPPAPWKWPSASRRSRPASFHPPSTSTSPTRSATWTTFRTSPGRRRWTW